MWFIQLLPILFLATRPAERFPLLLALGAAVAAHVLAASVPEGGKYAMASKLTGWTTIDSFLLFFVYFYCGHRFRDRIFAFARWLGRHWRTAVIGLIAWAIVEQLAVMRGLPETPGATLLFGLAGGVAVIAVAVILDRAAVAVARLLRTKLAHHLSLLLRADGGRPRLADQDGLDRRRRRHVPCRRSGGGGDAARRERARAPHRLRLSLHPPLLGSTGPAQATRRGPPCIVT